MKKLILSFKENLKKVSVYCRLLFFCLRLNKQFIQYQLLSAEKNPITLIRKELKSRIPNKI